MNLRRSFHFIFCFMTALLFAMQGTALADEKTYTNSIGMEFVLISAGSFSMGADKTIENAGGDEIPQHRVSISKPFYLGKYEVTQAEWTKVMGSNPSAFEGHANPVENVSWNDAQEFINRLNQQEGTTVYRLPTEAEWEYAARAGTTSTYFFGDDAGSLASYAWFAGNSGGTTHPVGQKQPNAWGLHDMHGNVLEWAQDWYDERYYSSFMPANPQGPASGSFRVRRGGSWSGNSESCRVADRSSNSPDFRNDNIGFRLVFSPQNNRINKGDHPK
jgi:formylglycine-generating enzyme required for sulfatase activity